MQVPPLDLQSIALNPLDEECFFPNAVQSVRAMDYVGTGDKSGIIFTKTCNVVINTYQLRDGKELPIPGELLSCIDPQVLPSIDYEGHWEKYDAETF